MYYIIFLYVFSDVIHPTPPPSHSEPDPVLDTSDTNSIPKNDRFERKHTLFLISLMEAEIRKNEDGLPKSIADLEKRMRLGKGKKKAMWQNLADKMTEQFSEIFTFERVARKWGVQVDAFKNCNLKNRTTGNGTTRFEFFNEMHELIGDRHDINFPCTAAPGRKPVLTEQAGQDGCTTPKSSRRSENEGRPLIKRRRTDQMEIMREIIQESDERHQQSMNSMTQSMSSMIQDLIKSNQELAKTIIRLRQDNNDK